MKAPSPKAADVSVAAPPSPVLLPCPFCGGADIFIPVLKGTWAKCTACEAEGPYARNPTEAVAAWNKRAVDPVRADLLAVLKLAQEDLELRCRRLLATTDAKWDGSATPESTLGRIRAAIAKATDSAATRTSSEASTSISNPSNTGVKDE